MTCFFPPCMVEAISQLPTMNSICFSLHVNEHANHSAPVRKLGLIRSNSVPLWLLWDTTCGLVCHIHYSGSWFSPFWPGHRFLDTWQRHEPASIVIFSDLGPTPKLNHQLQHFLWFGTTCFMVTDLVRSISSSISRIRLLDLGCFLEDVWGWPFLQILVEGVGDDDPWEYCLVWWVDLPRCR